MGVGFDLLGLCLGKIGDRVTARLVSHEKDEKTARSHVVIQSITGHAHQISSDSALNTASVAALHFLKKLSITQTIYLDIEKGIQGGSGLGSSACSAVAAVVAINGLLKDPLPKTKLFESALIGEKAASNSLHGDNVGPSLLGGMVLAILNEQHHVIELPVPKDLYYTIYSPPSSLSTKESRSVLGQTIALNDYIKQSGYLAQFIAGLYTNQSELLKSALHDVVIEPQRASLIPNFYPLKKAALQAGAYGCSISGAGPAVFALSDSKKQALEIADAMQKALSPHSQQETTIHVGPICKKGAFLID